MVFYCSTSSTVLAIVVYITIWYSAIVFSIQQMHVLYVACFVCVKHSVMECVAYAGKRSSLFSPKGDREWSRYPAAAAAKSAEAEWKWKPKPGRYAYSGAGLWYGSATYRTLHSSAHDAGSVEGSEWRKCRVSGSRQADGAGEKKRKER